MAISLSLKKKRFFEVQNLACKKKIANFIKNSCLNQMIVLKFYELLNAKRINLLDSNVYFHSVNM